MKQLATLAALCLLASCGTKQVIVWSGADIVGLIILSILIVVIGLLSLVAAIRSALDKRKRRFKEAEEWANRNKDDNNGKPYRNFLSGL